MALQGILNSKFSVRVSILIGRYLPPKLGYRFGRSISTFISRLENADITKSIRANQYIANGETNTRQELIEKTQRVLEHAGKCYYDMYHIYNRPDLLESLVPYSEPMKELEDLLLRDR